jgi:hypothetical protein
LPLSHRGEPLESRDPRAVALRRSQAIDVDGGLIRIVGDKATLERAVAVG